MSIHSTDLRTDVIKIQHPPGRRERGKNDEVTIDYSVVCRKRKMFAENGIKSQLREGFGAEFSSEFPNTRIHPCLCITTIVKYGLFMLSALLNLKRKREKELRQMLYYLINYKY